MHYINLAVALTQLNGFIRPASPCDAVPRRTIISASPIMVLPERLSWFTTGVSPWIFFLLAFYFLGLPARTALAQEIAPPSQPTASSSPTPSSQPIASPASAPAVKTNGTSESFHFEGTILAPNNRPVSWAVVQLASLKLKVTSGVDGVVRMSMPPGTYEIQVTAPGFVSHREMMNFDEAVAQAGFTIYMTYDLGEVVVTGATTEKLIAESPVKTEVIDRKAIEQKGASNLAQALDHTTGVRVENNCQNCGFTQVRLIGLDGRYTQILINGRPIFSSLAGVYGLEQIPKEMIDRIEVVKGGGSALYGGNAVAGVINVITKRPDRSFGAVNGGGYTLGDQWGGHFLGGNIGLLNDDKTLALSLFGSLRSQNAWDQNGDGFSDLSTSRSVAVGGSLFWDPLPRGTLELSFHALNERRRGGDNLDLPEFDAAVTEGGQTVRQGGEVRWRHSIRSGFSYEIGYALGHTQRNSYYGGGGNVQLPENPTPEQWNAFWEQKRAALGAYGVTRNPMHTGDGIIRFPFQFLGEMLLSAGVQTQVEHLRDEFPSYSRRIDEMYYDVGGLLELDWHFAPWNETLIGVRVDKHSKVNDAIVNPRVAFVLKPWSWLKGRTSFSTGFRAPQVFDEDLHVTIVGGEGVIVVNDPGLKVERSYSLAQQLESSFSLSRSVKATVSINGFYSLLTDAFVLDDVDDPATANEREFVRRNRGSTSVFGGELELKVNYRDRFNVRTGWTLEQARNSDPDPDFGSKAIFRTPEAYGFLEAAGRPLSRYGLELFTAVDFTGPMKVPHYAGYIAENTLVTSSWFTDWDVGVSYSFAFNRGPAVKLSLMGRNLFDSFQPDLDRGPNRDAGYIYGPALPRSLWFELKAGL
jgi:outer membrane receptor for ferrienterochelin and colicins